MTSFNVIKLETVNPITNSPHSQYILLQLYTITFSLIVMTTPKIQSFTNAI